MSQQHTTQTPQRHTNSTISQQDTTEQVEIGPLLVANRFFNQPIGDDEASHEAETTTLSALSAAAAEATASPSPRPRPRQLRDLNLTPAQQVAHGMQVYDLHVAANLVDGLVDIAQAEMLERSFRRIDAVQARERLLAVAAGNHVTQHQQQEMPFVVPTADPGWNMFDPQFYFANNPVLFEEHLAPEDYSGEAGVLDAEADIWLQQADVCSSGESTVPLSIPHAQTRITMPASADVEGYGGGQSGFYYPSNGSHPLRESSLQQPGRQSNGTPSERARLQGTVQSQPRGGLQGSCPAPGHVRRGRGRS